MLESLRELSQFLPFSEEFTGLYGTFPGREAGDLTFHERQLNAPIPVGSPAQNTPRALVRWKSSTRT